MHFLAKIGSEQITSRPQESRPHQIVDPLPDIVAV